MNSYQREEPKLKLTKARIDLVADALRKGAIIKQACACAGISDTSYHNWYKEFKENRLEPLDPDESLGTNPNREELLSYFVRETTTALSGYASKLLDKIHEANSWQAAAWILERRFPEEFGRRAAAPPVETDEDVQTESETTQHSQSETGKPEDNPRHPNYNGRPPRGTFEKLAQRWDQRHTAQEAQGRNGEQMPDV